VEHAVLRALGADSGQGWLFGRPAPVDVLGCTSRAEGALAG
jgi:EAL domain-containing protein (putative c-di-GMP-specific phosphodiesterase class I)